MIERVLAEASEFQNLRSLIVVRHGETLIEDRFNNGPSLDQPVNIKSASKSVLSAMVGIAIERGVLRGTDQAVLSVLGDQAPSPTDRDPRLADVTVGNLLSMQAGLERTSGDNYGRWVSSANWVRYALSRPFSAEPGGRMLYSTGSSHLLSAMLTRASGRTTRDLAQEWLGEPLGIAIPPWTQDPQGIYLGGNNMAMSPRALARFG
ncbi:MAG: serine hydrolase, partial [Alphaproteobacteria bacterium]|nr:serine hydrolase [Alphaproteobacteria bacterium]MBU1755734.1 serine hydrolase [Alphaproteobacteria bacterium]